MGQVQVMAVGSEQIGQPVPAIGGLEGHLRPLAGLGHCQRHGHRVVRDAHGVEDGAGFVHCHDDRPAAMQVDPDVASFHRGLLLLSRVGL